MNWELHRRAIVQLLLSLPWIDAVSAATRPEQAADLIDVHCHIFNATDLPAEKFLRIVFLDLYPPQGVHLLDTRDEGVVDYLIKLFLFILGAHGAPCAKHEIAVLNRAEPANVHWSDPLVCEKDTIAGVRAFLESLQLSLSTQVQDRGGVILQNAIQEAAKAGSTPALRASGADVATRAYYSATDVGRYLRWFTLFRQYRYVHIRTLIDFHSSQGFSVKALAPAMIDYSRWLDEEVKSPLPAQVEVIGLLRLRYPGVQIKPYVAFDPLREVYYRNGLDKVSPLKLAIQAAQDHGFIGVKLYPPMGFRPSGNTETQSYPKYVRDAIGGDLGGQLNTALSDLYETCVTNNLRILAHAAESNGAGDNYAKRADPAFWIPVFERYPNLSICLGHFGGFNYRSDGVPVTTPFPEASWEWRFGSYIAQKPGAPIYADLSYFSEILDQSTYTRRKFAQYFRSYAEKFDAELKHLMFGTDWIMTGIEKGYPNYTKQVAGFLSSDCGFDNKVVENVLSGNARRFLGLS